MGMREEKTTEGLPDYICS